jgi:hypothetical protein
MDDSGKRAGRGWAIGGAFAGQVGIFVAISALLAGPAGTPTVYEAPVPAVAPLPAISAPVATQPGTVPYTFSMYGQASGTTYHGVYPEKPSPVPAYTVKAGKWGETVGITLTLTIPDPSVQVTDLWVTFTEVSPNAGSTFYQEQMLYHIDSEPLPPGPHIFQTAWPSASEMAPGTTWLVTATDDNPGGWVDTPLASVTVAP